MNKKCSECCKLLTIECFPRLNDNRDWLGEARKMYPRSAVCSECSSFQASKPNEPTTRTWKTHALRCRRRTLKRFKTTEHEGIDEHHLEEAYKKQKGLCALCTCTMTFHTHGMGWNLCLEDREALGVWPSNSTLATVDRVDASKECNPYVWKERKGIANVKNFVLLCFACNQEKYYEVDAAQKLHERNVLLQQQIQWQKEAIESLSDLYCHSDTTQLLRDQNNALQEENTTLKRILQENFTQCINVLPQRPFKKRKVQSKRDSCIEIYNNK